MIDLLAADRHRIDDCLAQLCDRDTAGLPEGLRDAMRYAITGGGKRLRGALCLQAHRAFGGGGNDGIHDVACAIELVHTYSLVHDDLPCMDDDDLRRGRPTLHRVSGTAHAMALGAALIPLAFRILIRGARVLMVAPEPLVTELARGIGGGGMVGGQWLDLAAEGRTVSLPELAAIHEAKTGALFRASVALGARGAGAPPEQVAAAEAFGAALGLAFQVVDDILDETGDVAALGKTVGKDRQQEKATYPALLGMAGARERARSALSEGIARLRAAGVASADLEAVGEWVLARDH